METKTEPGFFDPDQTEFPETTAYNSGFIKLLGIETVSSDKDYVELRMPITPEGLQPHGFVHGGATIALLETAASIGTRNNANLEKELPFGIDVHVRHKKSGKFGYLKAVAELEKVEGNKWFWTVAAYDDEGDVLSDGIVMAKIVSLERLAEKEREREAMKTARATEKL